MRFLIVIAALLITFNTSFDETIPKVNFSQKDVRCLELNIHYEARGESLIGKKAVAHVTLNRAKSKRFPSDICKVVYQPGQFSWVSMYPNHKKTRVDPSITKIAIDTLSNKYRDVTKGALFFHAKTAEPFNRNVVAQIGNHIFYR